MTQAEFDALFHLEEGLWWFVGMRRVVDAFLGARRQNGLRCLEAGCGAGFNALDFTRRYGWQVFPSDYSSAALHFSAQRGVPRLLCADIAQLPYAAASVDCVVAMDVLAMLDEDAGRRALAESFRVLKPGGFLLIRTAAWTWLRGHHSVLHAEKSRYSLGELNAMLQQAGFAVVRSSYALFFLFPVIWLKRRVLEPLHLVKLESDVSPTAPWLDFLFRQTLLLEARLVAAGVNLPVGCSALVLAVKPE